LLERQREGIAKARASGKFKGRKPLPPETIAKIREMKADQRGATYIAKLLKIGRTSVCRANRGQFMRFDDRTKAGIGYRLRPSRDALDQSEFAAMAGIQASTYNQYEQGVNAPKTEFAHWLCDRHGLTLDWIFRGDQGSLKRNLADTIEALQKVRAIRLVVND
jgi:DNA-binding XRE family transcriptional regulator